ncbi:Phosphoenolpyruvate-protein phosphotransferase of PTS system [Caenispirillum salinarum AK4]|uniref:Phosphoenolpyruvate-protein phosphotransferase n=2 Tax=Caenispirillum TaxID=414051 RepID=K9HUI9_9PROT|nr:Phosphoenolpyruvate-protein phosphotransferase of PTS system [Caenispirillum salinarum AK4]
MGQSTDNGGERREELMAAETPDSGTVRPMDILTGLGVAPGVAVGTVYLHEAGAVHAPEYRIPEGRVESEQHRFAEAVHAAQRQLHTLRRRAERLPGAAGEELGYLLDAYHQMLSGSRLVRGVSNRIAEERVNAEAAVKKEIGDLIAAFTAMDDRYLAGRVADIRDIGQRLVRNLTKSPYKAFSGIGRDSVIVTHDLSPADTALLDPHTVSGFTTEVGGADSHTAIMARSLGLPAVVGVQDLTHRVRHGDAIVVDGTMGQVVLNPDADTLADYRKRRADFLRQRRALDRLRDVPAVTRDTIRVRLHANIELPSELEATMHAGAEGIGLLRSEFLFMNRADMPGEDEQTALLRQVVDAMDGRPVTVRTLDAGGDKLGSLVGGRIGPNPALGLRAIRLSLARVDLFETQLAAILRASAYGPVRILLPMIGTPDELAQARAVMDRVVRKLQSRRVPLPDPLPPLGVMIEVPGAALAADALAHHADFFAIGTNDLTQYTLAIDRTDDSVAHLYNPLHPAVLRLVQFAGEAANRAGIPVSICGEMAGDPRLTALLLGLGFRELSMSSTNIPRVKQRVCQIAMAEAARRAMAVMTEWDPARIGALLDDFNATLE